MRTIKRLALGLLVVVVLAVVGIAVLILTLDANLLKPVLHKVAREQGIELNIPGDIEWQFYPNIGLDLGVVQVSSLSGQEQLASIDGASVSVKLMPLLRDREILVNGIILDGLDVQYHVDENGDSPWAEIGNKDAAPTEEPAAPTDEQSLPTLAIETLDITNLNLSYSNAQSDDKMRVYDTQLSSQNFSLTGEPFALSLQSTIDYNDQPTARVQWSGPIALDMDAETFSTDSAQLQVQLGEAQAQLDLTNKTQWGEPFASAGTVALHPTPLTPLFKAVAITPPKVSSPNALQQVSAQMTYALDDQQAALTNVTVQLDQIHLQGELTVTNFEQPRIKMRWKGNTVPLDDYLPPPTEEEQEEAEPAPAEPLPTEALQALDLDAAIAFDAIHAKGLVMKQPELHVTAKNGLIKLEKLATNVADGSVLATGQLNARQPQAKLALQVDSENVHLGQILSAVADIDNISGQASASISAISAGATDQALIDNLIMRIAAKSQSLAITPINLTEQFCRALALAQQDIPQSYDWPNKTELEPVVLQLQLSDQTLALNQMSAEIANLLGSAQGQFNLQTGDFNIPLSLALGDFATEIPGCLPIKEKWRKRALPIRCKGNLDDIGVKTCLPDTKLITQMVTDKIKGEAQEKIAEKRQELEQKVEKKQDQVEQKLEDKTREVINKELGDEQTKEIEDKLKGTLDRLKGRTKPATTPAKETAPAPVTEPATTPTN